MRYDLIKSKKKQREFQSSETFFIVESVWIVSDWEWVVSETSKIKFNGDGSWTSGYYTSSGDAEDDRKYLFDNKKEAEFHKLKMELDECRQKIKDLTEERKALEIQYKRAKAEMK